MLFKPLIMIRTSQPSQQRKIDSPVNMFNVSLAVLLFFRTVASRTLNYL